MTLRRQNMIERDQIDGHSDEVHEKIAHLMLAYHWSWWEAMEYFYYEPYDPIDWVGSQWEEPCSLPPC